MIHLNPKTIDAVEITVVSKGRTSSGDPSERRVCLGLFTPDVSEDDFQAAIAEHGLFYELLGSISLEQGQARLKREARQVTDGVVFESADECCRHMAQGVTHADIEEGFDWSNSDILIQGYDDYVEI